MCCIGGSFLFILITLSSGVGSVLCLLVFLLGGRDRLDDLEQDETDLDPELPELDVELDLEPVLELQFELDMLRWGLNLPVGEYERTGGSKCTSVKSGMSGSIKCISGSFDVVNSSIYCSDANAGCAGLTGLGIIESIRFGGRVNEVRIGVGTGFLGVTS